jgi:D-tyrosyl-tRNA(Tyr) deacylase
VRAVLQRVTDASVRVAGNVVGSLDRPGLVVLLGVAAGDSPAVASELASKVWTLRILRDEQSCSDLGAPLLVISQFTLYGDARKGRRPSWAAAAPADDAAPIYESFCAALESMGATVARGVFGADMAVTLTNDGPFTVVVDR